MSQSACQPLQYEFGKTYTHPEYGFEFICCPQSMSNNPGICLELCVLYLTLKLKKQSNEKIISNLQTAIMDSTTSAPENTVTETYLSERLHMDGDEKVIFLLSDIIMAHKENTFTHALIEFFQNTDEAHCIAIYKNEKNVNEYYIEIYEPNLGIIINGKGHEEKILKFFQEKYIRQSEEPIYVYNVDQVLCV